MSGSQNGTASRLALGALILTLAACSAAQPTATPPPPTHTPSPTPSSTQVPEPTERPKAADTPVPEPTSTPQVADTPVPPTPAEGDLEDISFLADWNLDVRLPEGAEGPFATLLLLHGNSGDRRSLYAAADYFSERGYATVVADWLGGHGNIDWIDYFPTAFCALAWVHSNAGPYGFDPERVVVLGHSAGGHAASIIGTVDDPAKFLQGCPHQLPAEGWTRGVITYGGVLGTKEVFLTLPLPLLQGKTMLELYNGTLQLPPDERDEFRDILVETPYESWRDISGLSADGTRILHSVAPYWVDGSEPPFLLVHGESDPLGVAGQEAFVSQLQAAGVEASLVVIPQANHDAIRDTWRLGFEEACQAIEAFLTELVE